MPALAQVRVFDVPSEEASKSIPELARQADVQIVGPGAPLQSVITPEVKGSYDVVVALEMMLKGTDLKIGRTADGILTISVPGQKNVCIDRGESMTNKSSLTTTVSWFAMLFASLQCAVAQSNDSQSVETIVVTGVRASLQSAQDIKMKSSEIVDTIVAEDIGKLPDNNVIEALQHVTGVQVSRNAAEANQILIRGLPDVATVVSGREIFTSTGRFMTLQDVPAELLARVDVHKSSTASDLEGGIAGLIDVRLHRPFDFDGLQIAGSGRATWSNLADHIDPLASALISNRWQTGIGEIGVLLDVSYSKTHYKEEILDNYISSQSIEMASSPTACTYDASKKCAYIPLTEGAQSVLGRRERAAVDFSAQWRPNQNLEFYTDVFYTRYRNPNSVDFFVGLPWIGANPATATLFPGSNEVKTVEAGYYDLTSSQSFRSKTDTYQIAMGGTWTGDKLTVSSEVAYTDSTFKQTGYILDTHYYPGDPPAYKADFNYKGTGTPYMNVPLAAVTDPANMVMRQWYDQWSKQSGNEIDWRADATYEIAARGLKSVEFGVRYGNRFAQNRGDNTGGQDCDSNPAESSPVYAQQGARNLSAACASYRRVANGRDADGNIIWNTVPNGPAVTLNQYPGSYHITGGSMFDGKFGITKFMAPDPEYMFSHVGDLRQLFGLPATAPSDDLTQSFDDREISWAGYVKGNFDFDLGSMPVDGNIGIRLIDTSATQKAYTLVVTDHGATASTPVTTNRYSFDYSPAVSKKDNFDWLPSLNARIKVQDDFFVRIGLSKTVTRPTFAQLNPGLSLSASTATLLGSGSTGNPNLTPVQSKNADVTFEYYFGPSNNLTTSLFYRRVKGYIGSYNTEMVIGGITYQVSQPRNGSDGDIKGIEVGYQQFFDFLPGIWSGLGVQLNGTYVDGSFQNISKYSYNAVGIYEKGPFSLRVAYNWRSGFSEGAAPGGGQNPQTIYAKSQPWLDLSASYKATDRLTFTVDATNLLDSYFQDSFGKGDLAAIYPRDTRRFDGTVSLGLRYRL
ncbi:TonB-dependent receptor [Rhizomicrobium electricum]|uniref:TonB-dependent receptor n=1 Tax=Rhizomicrobium electricum TaxID=480070 RepID=UPI00141DB45A|nr:TonB-dependent receptor [Rhizomicrobium electricum]NIJ49483.1 TonB-dependent receptor [Rhizomicrobium electricum]